MRWIAAFTKRQWTGEPTTTRRRSTRRSAIRARGLKIRHHVLLVATLARARRLGLPIRAQGAGSRPEELERLRVRLGVWLASRGYPNLEALSADPVKLDSILAA